MKPKQATEEQKITNIIKEVLGKYSRKELAREELTLEAPGFIKGPQGIPLYGFPAVLGSLLRQRVGAESEDSRVVVPYRISINKATPKDHD